MKVYINEDKLALLEGNNRSQTARKRTKQVIVNHFHNAPQLYQPNEITNGLPLIDYLEKQVINEFFESRSRRSEKGKFICLEPMVARIILNAGWEQDLPDNNGVIARLQSILNYIEELYLQGKIDPQTDIPLDSTIESLNEVFGKVIDEREASEAEARNNKEFIANENYEILDDVSYEQAHKIGNYSYSGLRLCYTQSKETWKNSFQGDSNKVYVCLSKDWKDIIEEHGQSLLKQYPDANAYDKYGLSMIFIFVNKEGDLVYSNTRWNHQANYGNGRSVDHAFTKDDISDLIGVNFDERFKGYTKEELDLKRVTFENVEQMLAQGIDLTEIFDYVGQDVNGFKLVYFQNMYNFVKPNNQLLSHEWFDDADEFNNGFGAVKLNGKWNFVDENNQLLSTQWFDDARGFKSGFGPIELNNKWNYIKTDGTFLWDKPLEEWFDKVYGFWGNYGNVELNNKYNIIRQDGTLVWKHPIEEWFDEIMSFGENIKIISSNKKSNVINCQSGNLLIKNWLNDIDLTYLSPSIKGQKGHIRFMINGILYAMMLDGSIESMWQSDVCGLEKSLYYDELAKDIWKWLYDDHNGDRYGYWNDLWEFYKTRICTNGLTDAAEKYAEYKRDKEFGGKLYSFIINTKIKILTEDAFVALQKVTIHYFNNNPIEEPIVENTRSKKIYIDENKLSLIKESQDELTFYGFYTQVKNFMKELLKGNVTAEPSQILKMHGIGKKELISALKKKGLLTSKENIDEVPNEDDEAKLRARHTITYSVPKKDFEKKFHRLYSELFENEWKSKSVLSNEKEEIQKILDNDTDNAYKKRGGYKIQENQTNEISSQFIQDRIANTFERNQDGYKWDENKGEYVDVPKDNRINKFRNIAVHKLEDEHPYNGIDISNYNNDDDAWVEANKDEEIFFLDSDYKSLEDLYNGVKCGDLLIHCRRMVGREAERYIYPEVGETVKQAYGADYADAECEIEPLVYASSDFSWANGKSSATRNGVYFIKSDNFMRYLGGEYCQAPNGQIERYYPQGITIESGDWFSDEPAEVVAVLRKKRNFRKTKKIGTNYEKTNY